VFYFGKTFTTLWRTLRYHRYLFRYVKIPNFQFFPYRSKNLMGDFHFVCYDGSFTERFCAVLYFKNIFLGDFSNLLGDFHFLCYGGSFTGRFLTLLYKHFSLRFFQITGRFFTFYFKIFLWDFSNLLWDFHHMYFTVAHLLGYSVSFTV